MALSKNAMRVLPLLKEGKSAYFIARTLKMTIDQVEQHASEIRVAGCDLSPVQEQTATPVKRPLTGFTKDEIGTIIQMRGAGKSAKEIAEVLHRTLPSVTNKIQYLIKIGQIKKRITPKQPKDKPSEVVSATTVEPVEDTHNPVSNPSHYTTGRMECIDEMMLIFGAEETKSFCKLNAWKYRARAPYKGKQTEDTRKADQYLEFYENICKYGNPHGEQR